MVPEFAQHYQTGKPPTRQQRVAAQKKLELNDLYQEIKRITLTRWDLYCCEHAPLGVKARAKKLLAETKITKFEIFNILEFDELLAPYDTSALTTNYYQYAFSPRDRGRVV